MSSSTSATTTSTSTAGAATTSAVTHTIQAASNLKVVGVILAIISGVLIGSSFVFKKKGLLRSQAGGELGEGVAYLKSALWWLGMGMMILGEICNFAAYAFVEAIVVTPLGALSVVICAILSSFFLNEKLSFFGWLGCGLCILGSTIIALNGPKEETIGQIREFQKLFLAPGFLAFISILIVSSLVIVFYFAPKYGKKSMFWYISVCSMIGGISVSVTTGLGAAIVQTAMGDNQFKFWFMYFLFAFVVITLLVEVYYLNVALALFNTAMVTPTYYVLFTFCSMVTTVVLFQGLKAGVTQIITIVMAFLVICVGITILQMSKVDPEKLNKLDRRSTILLQAARSQTETIDEKGAIGYEDPGMDTLRGSFGAVGSIIRARTVKRMSMSSRRDSTNHRLRPPGAAAPYDGTASWLSNSGLPTDGLQRHQLYDAPVPRDDASSFRAPSVHSQLVNKRPTIKFGEEDLVHSYNRPGQGDNSVLHERRQAAGVSVMSDGYPPLPSNRATVASDVNLLELSDSPEIPIKTPTSATPTPKPGDTNKLSTGLPKIDFTPINLQQTLELPSQIESEHSVHSAPPTIYQRFARSPKGPVPLRKDSRDLFDTRTGLSNASTPALVPQAESTPRDTMLTFPSVTDSSPSVWEEDDTSTQLPVPKESKRDKSKERGRERDRSKEKRGNKKYPKGAGEDDDEESRSLWRATTLSSEESGEDPMSPPIDGGIRLVVSKPSGPL